MSGTSFEYLPGFLRVEFAQGAFDFINLALKVNGDTVVATPCEDDFVNGDAEVTVKPDGVVRCYVTSVFCPFPQLLAWLEAITCGVEECAFAWDAEGPEGRLAWANRQSYRGHLTIAWDVDNVEVRFLLDTRQMIGALYWGFRRFVESERFDEERYGRPLRALRSGVVERWLAKNRLPGERLTQDQAKELARNFVVEHIDVAFTDERSGPYGDETAELLFSYSLRLPANASFVGCDPCVGVSPTGNVRYLGTVGE